MSALQDSWVGLSPHKLPGFGALAEMVQINIGARPIADALQRMAVACDDPVDLARKFTSDKISDEQVMGVISSFGLHQGQPLRTIRGPVQSVEQSVCLVLGGQVGPMCLRVAELVKQTTPMKGCQRVGRVFGLAHFHRECRDPEERIHPVMKPWRREDHQPTELHMMQYLFDSLPVYLDSHTLPVSTYEMKALIKAFVKKLPGPTNVYLPLDAGSQFLALQVRRELRNVWGSEFDQDDIGPCLFFSAMPRELAVTADQYGQVDRFQRPLLLPKGLVKLAIELCKPRVA